MDAPTRRDFERELRALLFHASQDERRQQVTLRAAELHRRVGGYPDNTGETNRMPVCCSVMQAEMQQDDRIIARPPSGRGPSLTISYAFPRTHRLATVRVRKSRASGEL